MGLPVILMVVALFVLPRLVNSYLGYQMTITVATTAMVFFF